MTQANQGSEPVREACAEARFTKLSDAPTRTSNRRVYPRFGVDVDVSLGSDHNFYSGLAENLSAGGVFVATHCVKPVGNEIEFSVYLSEVDRVVKGKGEVRWIREYNEHSDVPPGMGIRFIELAEGSAEAIEEFLARREPLLYDDE
jgi:uncharacterized protein (TIGR02266 family)